MGSDYEFVLLGTWTLPCTAGGSSFRFFLHGVPGDALETVTCADSLQAHLWVLGFSSLGQGHFPP